MQPLLQWKSNDYYTTWVRVFVALGIQHAMRMHHIKSLACPALQYFPTLSHKRHDFRGKKGTDNKMCVYIFSTTFVWHNSHSKTKWVWYNKKTYIGLHVKYPCSRPVLMKLEFSRQVFEKSSNIKFHEIPSNGSRVVPCGRTDRHDEANSRFSQFCESALTDLSSVETALSVQFPVKHYATRA